MLLRQQDSGEDCDSPDDELKFEHTKPYSFEYCRCCCFPDGVGEFTFEMLTVGATAGRQCCSTLIDAISTWDQNCWRNSNKLNLEDAHISISPGHILPGAQHTVDPQIELEWHDESVHLRLFQPEGSSGNVSTYQRNRCWTFTVTYTSIGMVASELDYASTRSFPQKWLHPSNASSLASTQRIFQWLHECTSTHRACRQADQRSGNYGEADIESLPPKRILEIIGSQVVLRNNAMSREPYVCLSHCWGKRGVPFKLKHSNFGTLQNGARISTLPRNFRDAILVCLRLGLRFIWIDALCGSSAFRTGSQRPLC